MLVSSWISPKTVKGKPSRIHGLGFFAKEPIKAGELIGVKGGHIVDRTTLEQYAAIIQGSEIQLDADLFIAPLTPEELSASMIYIITRVSLTVGCAVISPTLRYGMSKPVRS